MEDRGRTEGGKREDQLGRKEVKRDRAGEGKRDLWPANEAWKCYQ